MRVLTSHVGPMALLALFLLGASCDSGRGSSTAETPETDQSDTQKGQLHASLKGVDVGDLTSGERERWVELVNGQLSPCGQPISVAQCVADGVACSACVPAARYLVRLIAEGFEPGEIEEFYAARYDASKALKIDIKDSPLRGAPMATLTIVEFSDFECPYCGAAHPFLKQLLDRHAGRVRLVFRHYPLDGHVNALPAAHAAAAAHMQGKFWPLADLLFENQRDLSAERIRELAQEAGLDMARFDADLGSDAVRKKVEADKAAGKALGVSGTPTLFVNNRAYPEPFENLSKYIKEELGE